MSEIKKFVLPGFAHERVIDESGVDFLPGRQNVSFPGYYARTTGAVWKTGDMQALIRAESRTEQLAAANAPPATRGE